ncbi:MAG: hypothetical protein M0036_08105 [Desulfobacteraceae bacterium]|nr:hypothetical protein [Desulfobacteraceae bacterium]
MTVKSENRGGSRNGAGRKAKQIDFDAKFKKEVLASVRRLEKKYQRKFLDAILERVFKNNVIDTAVASIFKQYSEIFMEKKTQPAGDDQRLPFTGPAIGLPPMRPDPALEIVKIGDNRK